MKIEIHLDEFMVPEIKRFCMNKGIDLNDHFLERKDDQALGQSLFLMVVYNAICRAQKEIGEEKAA